MTPRACTVKGCTNKAIPQRKVCSGCKSAMHRLCIKLGSERFVDLVRLAWEMRRAGAKGYKRVGRKFKPADYARVAALKGR